MFGTNLECGIKAVKVRVSDVDGRTLRRCRVVLAHEFTLEIARELGDGAVAMRTSLRTGEVEKAVMPIDGIAALGAFTARDGGIEIGRMVGIKATALAAKKDDDGPTIQLEFEFQWQEDAWLFLGRNCNATADVVLTKRQLALAIGDTAN